ncbi:MAG TPA: sigma-70 family RNA polymerase sigma factor [Anaerolineales bacterium]|nr:sigma-70 family RNA polymerase sigma factor [Anaerolineales bacterium]
MPAIDLIRSARAGDPAAWEAILHDHYEPVFRLAYLITGDPEDSDDVAQETFIRAHRFFKRYDSTRALRPWLLSIAANLARNRRRSIGRYYAALQRVFRRSELDPQPGVETRAAARIESSRLWEAIRRLSQDDQNVIYLRYFLELPVKDAADALDIAPGTVKSRLSRALERLKAVIQADFPELDAELMP